MATFKPTVRKAKRYKVKASIMLEGLSGRGKTGLALCFAHALVGHDWNKVGVVDTENSSADLIVGQHAHIGERFGEFLKVDLTEEIGYSPMNYIAAANQLLYDGCEAIIFDSSTHAWNRSGGVLDLVIQAEESGKTKNNKFASWNTPEVILNKNALFEMIRNQKYHVITTVRVKEKFGMDTNEQNKSVVKSLGEQQIQTEGLKYEPDLVLSMVSAGSTTKAPVARVTKSRYPMLEVDQEYEFTPALLEQIRLFLEEGADPDELLRLQHKEYEIAVKTYCEANPTQKQVWAMLKQSFGFEHVAITEVPLNDLKSMYMQLTTDIGGKK